MNICPNGINVYSRFPAKKNIFLATRLAASQSTPLTLPVDEVALSNRHYSAVTQPVARYTPRKSRDCRMFSFDPFNASATRSSREAREVFRRRRTGVKNKSPTTTGRRPLWRRTLHVPTVSTCYTASATLNIAGIHELPAYIGVAVPFPLVERIFFLPNAKKACYI